MALGSLLFEGCTPPPSTRDCRSFSSRPTSLKAWRQSAILANSAHPNGCPSAPVTSSRSGRWSQVKSQWTVESNQVRTDGGVKPSSKTGSSVTRARDPRGNIFHTLSLSSHVRAVNRYRAMPCHAVRVHIPGCFDSTYCCSIDSTQYFSTYFFFLSVAIKLKRKKKKKDANVSLVERSFINRSITKKKTKCTNSA